MVTMATSEHMIMQNEALVALGLIAALDLGENDDNRRLARNLNRSAPQKKKKKNRSYHQFTVAAEKDFEEANLVAVLHKLLSDERSAPEIKYNSMILICAVMGSGETPLTPTHTHT